MTDLDSRGASGSVVAFMVVAAAIVTSLAIYVVVSGGPGWVCALLGFLSGWAWFAVAALQGSRGNAIGIENGSKADG